ncbi:hypothetical protein DFH27DRAFT_275199 [Peziza echinospora]|nr:hypothetical protein DFH27DRAFT_275199 [Peziza echinospora]
MEPVVSAREAYISQVARLLQLHSELDTKLASVEANAQSAGTKLSEVHQKLRRQLNSAKVSSTVGSALSIVGVVLLLTPAAPVGIGLTAAGMSTSVGTSIAESFLFEAGASNAFAQAFGGYTSSAEALQKLFGDIEETKTRLFESLVELVATLGLPGPGDGFHAGQVPPSELKVPSGPEGLNMQNTNWAHGPQEFTAAALIGLIVFTTSGAARSFATKSATQLSELLGSSGGKLLVKGSPVLRKAVPVLSIAIDIGSIVSTWTTSNKTLLRAGKLRNDIHQSATAFREMVEEYHSSLEQLFGDDKLQASLRKLMNLPRPTPSPSGGPTADPEKACEMLAFMQEKVEVPLLLFVQLVGSVNEDPKKNSYHTEIMPEEDVVQLSRLPASAPIVDAVYEMHPDLRAQDAINSTKDEHKEDLKDEPHPSVILRGFRASWIPFAHNVCGSSRDYSQRPWADFWEWYHSTTTLRITPDPAAGIAGSPNVNSS